MNSYNKQKINNLKSYKDFVDLLREEEEKSIIISLCSGTGCKAAGSDEVYNRLIEEINSYKNLLKKELKIRRTGCHGFCDKGPLMIFSPSEVCYVNVTKEDIPEIMKNTLKGDFVDRLLYKDYDGKVFYKEFEIPFYSFQKRILLGNNSRIDSKNIEDYIMYGGYSALLKVLKEMSPEDVLDEVKKSGLRGRGGGGFPTGFKWEITKNSKDKPKYVIVNADEGDPGAYMDRSILEGNPHSILEGLIIAGYVIGAEKGFIYVRQEYPLAVENITYAVKNAFEYGFLGENILGSGFNFDVEVYKGAGAFVCGEETALIKSIEGKRGMPSPKPPFPAEKGLYGKPTCINNVETFANIPIIINNGSEWYSKIGTESSKGTKIFALTGAVKNSGLVEVPMGISLRDIVFKIGGGIKDDKKFKAVQIGGPSGGCIPQQYLDVIIDYEKVKELGSMMGSGGMIVIDEDTCMVNLARYFMDFIQEESCGQCTPCRIGTRRMLEILDRITKGKGQENDIEKLEKLATTVAQTSLCGLGKTAPNPVFSTLKYFRHEFEEHIITQKSCERLHVKAKVKMI